MRVQRPPRLIKRQVMERAPVAHAIKGPTSGPARIRGNAYGPEGAMYIEHEEFVCDLTLTDDPFALLISAQSAGLPPGTPCGQVNPGVTGGPTLFPWFSNIANSFSEYKFDYLEFTIRTEQSTNAPGSIFMGFDANVQDQYKQYTKKAQILTLIPSSRGAPWQDISIRLTQGELRGLSNWRYIARLPLSQSTPVPGFDPKTYFLGQLLIGCSNCSALGNAELHAKYGCWVRYPVADTVNPLSVASITGYLNNTSPTQASPFGVSLNQQSPLSGLGPTASGNTIVFNQAGKYIVNVVFATNGSAVATGSLIVPSGGATIVSGFQSFQLSDYYIIVLTVVSPSIGTALAFNWTTLSGVTDCQLFISPFDNSGLLTA
jgi:hypothetical protein